MELPALIITILCSVISKLVVDAIQNRRRGPLDRAIEEEALAARRQAKDARDTALKKRVEALKERYNAYEQRRDALVELVESKQRCGRQLDPPFFNQFRFLADELKSIRSEGTSMQDAEPSNKEFKDIRTRATSLQVSASL